MDTGTGNNKFTSSPFTPASAAPAPPSPPSEVKVRTMRSDLDAMAKSGGGLPRFENVKVSGLSATTASPEAVVKAKGKSSAVVILVVIASLAVLGIIGYFGYRVFFSGSSSPTAPAATSIPTVPTTAPMIPAVTTSTPTTTVPFTHVSLFKTPADQVLTLDLSSAAASSSAALETFDQQLSTLLAGANKTATLIEIDVKGADGHDLSIEELLNEMNAQVLSPSFLGATFNPDATFFVYRDANGFWPGFVIQLAQGQNWLSVASSVMQLEFSPSIGNFFLTNPGAPSPDGFTDSTAGTTPVRVLPFLDATPPAYFTYGQYRSDLILSTSQDGFSAAAARL